MIRQDYLAPYLQQRWIKFRNTSNEDVPAYGVMRIADSEMVDDTHVRLMTTKPDDTFSCLYLVNGPVSVKAGDSGDGTYLLEGGTVKYSSGTPMKDEEWGPTNDDWGLVKNRPGFLMQGTALDETLKHVFAVQSEVKQVYGQTDAAITKGTTPGTVSIYCGAAGSEADTGWDIEVYNRFVTTLGSGKKIICWRIHGVWYVAGEC